MLSRNPNNLDVTDSPQVEQVHSESLVKRWAKRIGMSIGLLLAACGGDNRSEDLADTEADILDVSGDDLDLGVDVVMDIDSDMSIDLVQTEDSSDSGDVDLGPDLVENQDLVDDTREVDIPVMAPRMDEETSHVSIHYFSNRSVGSIAQDMDNMKNELFGDQDAPTCYEGPNGRVQFVVQTELNPSECISSGVDRCADLLEDRITEITRSGLGIHLLLPLHYPPSNGEWEGIDWRDRWMGESGHFFMPYQPTVENEGGPYDVLSEQFQVPLLRRLVAMELLENVGVVYLSNELGFAEGALLDNASDWEGRDDWLELRQEAIANTVLRVLSSGREAAGDVPVGIKFARLDNPNTGWTPHSAGQTDQLARVLNVMATNDDVLGYDVYLPHPRDLEGVTYDFPNFTRLAPFLSAFSGGRFEIAEFGGLPWEGDPAFLDSETVQGMAEYWGPNLSAMNGFGWNAGSHDMYDENAGELNPGARGTLDGMIEWAEDRIGAPIIPENQCSSN